MTYQFGKALAGGTPVDERAMRRLHVDQLLADELAYTERLLDLVKAELRRRGGMPQLVRQLDEARTELDDVAGVIEAKDRCEGVARASPATKRRLLRAVDDSDVPVCRRDRGARG